jgi:hypothetical protein
MKPGLSVWFFLLCGGLCLGGASCSPSTTVRRCVRAGDAELCGNRNAAGIMLEANGLKSGSTVKLSSVATGSSEVAVGGSGHLVGTVGFISAADIVVTVTATTADGEPLTGDLSFPKP